MPGVLSLSDRKLAFNRKRLQKALQARTLEIGRRPAPRGAFIN